MYESLKPWLLQTATVYPYIVHNAYGDRQFGEPYDIRCYPEGKVQIVKNSDGKEVVSNTILYVEGTATINDLDKIVFEGRETEIVAITSYYRGSGPDVKMVYL